MRDQLQESQLSREKSLGVVVGFHREESAQPVGFCFLTGGGGEVDFSARNVYYPGLSAEETLPSAPLLRACDRMPPAVLEGSVGVPGLGEVETGSPISLELPLPCQGL